MRQIRLGKHHGFSILELMIAVAIVAIVTAIALPSYQSSVQKSRRAEAQTALMDFAGSAERVFTESSSYVGVALPANTEYYTFSFPAAVTALTYIIRATPTAVQAEDKCGTMNLSNTGFRSKTGSEADCW